MSSYDCQHFSPLTSQEGLLGYSKVNELDLLYFFVKKNILRFDVPMTYVPTVQVVKSIQ